MATTLLSPPTCTATTQYEPGQFGPTTPRSLSPQVPTLPSEPSAVQFSPTSPRLPLPQAQTLPSDRSARLCLSAAAMATTAIRGFVPPGPKPSTGTGVVRHLQPVVVAAPFPSCPASFWPQARR